MKNKFVKNDLIFYFQTQDFPENLIFPDVLIHKELIFSEDSEEPELSQTNKKLKLSQCYVLEDEIEPKGKGNFKKGTQARGVAGTGAARANFKGKQENFNVWRKNEPEENSDFFDNFKGKSDSTQVEKFKRNLEVSVTRENSLSIEKTKFNDHLQNGAIRIIKDESDLHEVASSLSADNFFENADKIMEIINTPTITPLKNNFKSDPNPKIVYIEQLSKINEHLQYPKDENLWYIFHPVAKSAFGPLSSPNIKEMYESKMLDGQSEIRFIDIYNLKNKKPFAFFKLKDIEREGFLEEIDISPLLKVAVAIKSNKSGVGVVVSDHDSQNQKIQKPQQVLHEKNSQEIQKPKPIEENKSSSVKVNEELNLKPPKERKHAEHIEEASVDDFFDGSKGGNGNSKKIKKVPKGKPVDLDVKLSKKK
jgi:hypothetical protein